MSTISLQSVCKHFGAVAVLVDCSLVVEGPAIVAVEGHSGSGKTTLLRVVAGLERADRGVVSLSQGSGVRGQGSEDRGQRSEDRGQGAGQTPPSVPPRRGGKVDVGMVFQHPVLMPHLRVRGNLALGYRLHYNVVSTTWWEKPEPSELRQRLDEVIQLLELDAFQQRLPSELSGGQRQRAALGRCLVRRPAVFLLDEPLASLDVATATRLRTSLRETFQRWGATVLWVTHDPAEARAVADRIVTMSEGRIVRDEGIGVRG